ncbi:hypothetical protein ACMDB5_12935 [Flavobacterium sp. W1B]|uniref:hypothetical protein n=1 Tax=Flavobacterium sp. W1B TaxID=3394146 RepID=UPI0039BC9318
MDEKIIGYKPNGQAIFLSEYKKIIQNRIDTIVSGTSKTFTSEEVLKEILKNKSNNSKPEILNPKK